MRVLWICRTPGEGAQLLGAPPFLVIGWVAALERAVASAGEVELSLAFPWAETHPEPLEGGGRRYLPFPRYPRGGRLRRLLFDVTCSLEPETELAHLERAVERARPDLIHVWGTEELYGLIAGRTRLPVLIELQGLRTPYTAAYFSGLSRYDLLRHGSARRLLTGRSLLHRYGLYRRTAARERRILANARFVSGRTHWDRQSAAVLAPNARYFHCDRVLRAPFYDARWRPREAAGPMRLISTVRANAYKGLETVWRSAELLRKLSPVPPEWTLVGVRPNDEAVRVVERKLGRTAASLGLATVGRQPAPAVARRLADSDLFVHPSHIDNSPNGLAEAMRVGIPVVSTNVGGIPSMVEDHRDGLLVPPGDPWAMAGAVLELANDPGLASRLAASALRQATERHDPSAIAKRLAGIYRQVLRGHKAGAPVTIA